MRPKKEVGLQMHYHGGVSEHMKNISIWPFKQDLSSGFARKVAHKLA